MSRKGQEQMGVLHVVKQSRNADASDPAAGANFDISPASLTPSDSDKFNLNAQCSHSLPGTGLTSWRGGRLDTGELFEKIHGTIFMFLTGLVGMLDQGVQLIRRGWARLWSRNRKQSRRDVWHPQNTADISHPDAPAAAAQAAVLKNK